MLSLSLITLLLAAPSAAEQVKSLLLDQAESWNRGDLQRFTALYAEDALFLSPSGLTQGRSQVLARYQKRYPDRKAMGTLSLELIETRTAEKLVTVAARWRLAYPDKPAASGLTLIVLQARGGSWEIVQDASM